LKEWIKHTELHPQLQQGHGLLHTCTLDDKALDSLLFLFQNQVKVVGLLSPD